MMHEENLAFLLILKCKLDYIKKVPAGLIMPTCLLEKNVICCYLENIEKVKAVPQQTKQVMRCSCIALSALSLGAKRGLEVTAIPRPLYPREVIRYPFCRQ